MDDKSLITNNLSSIYKNTFYRYTVQDKEPFKNKLKKKIDDFENTIKKKNKTNKKRSVLGKVKGQVKKIMKNLKEKGKRQTSKKSENVSTNN